MSSELTVMHVLKSPFAFELVTNNGLPPFERNGQAMNGHFRIADAHDDAIATCYLREHAELIVGALNATK